MKKFETTIVSTTSIISPRKIMFLNYCDIPRPFSIKVFNKVKSTGTVYDWCCFLFKLTWWMLINSHIYILPFPSFLHSHFYSQNKPNFIFYSLITFFQQQTLNTRTRLNSFLILYVIKYICQCSCAHFDSSSCMSVKKTYNRFHMITSMWCNFLNTLT